MIEINWHPSRKDLRIFSMLLIGFFALVAWGIARRTGSTTVAMAVFGIAALVGMVGMAFPRVVRPVYVGWMVAAFPIGWTISHIILAVIFYLLFTPIGLLLRLFGHDAMQRRFDPSASTYWEPRSRKREPRSYFKQF